MIRARPFATNNVTDPLKRPKVNRVKEAILDVISAYERQRHFEPIVTHLPRSFILHDTNFRLEERNNMPKIRQQSLGYMLNHYKGWYGMRSWSWIHSDVQGGSIIGQRVGAICHGTEDS